MKFNDPKDWFGYAEGFGGGRQSRPQTREGWLIAVTITALVILLVALAGHSGASNGFHP